MRTFEDYLDVILKHEGGYVFDKVDPGGETKYGISARAFPQLDIKNLTIEAASKIYYHNYWTPMNLEDIPQEELKLHLFDMGVNAGVKTAIKILQALLDLSQDGIIGPKTVEAIKNYNGNIIEDYKLARKLFYDRKIKDNPKLAKFKKGWYRRVETTQLN